MQWMTILGILLLIWVIYDLMTGKVWLHRAFRRTEEPKGYWVVMTLWFVVAVSCFYWDGF
ncbi:MAG: hypothetical protein K5905_05450 [Roseibium sp.]|uniref:hypothetical protein n=1 Tax=Roseibium sp. TaxID=1936156 RepID=UPI00262E292D|nr:hypothetical protein [Roseibium sp.]MCV0424893.1 hypothetical protein [Roseibium sp.]